MNIHRTRSAYRKSIVYSEGLTISRSWSESLDWNENWVLGIRRNWSLTITFTWGNRYFCGYNWNRG